TPLPSEAPTPAPERERERDLNAELTLALSGMSACLAGVTDAPARTRLDVRARVMPNGAVGQVTVSAPGWPAEALRCFESVASNARLGAPVPDAPRTVSASIVVERIASASTTTVEA